MADAVTVNVESNGYRNVIIRCTNLSDGTGEAAVKKYDASSAGIYGVSYAGTMYYPGLHTSLVGLDYDIQDMKLRIMWDATSPVDIIPLGSAPESFDWREEGGIRVPAGLVGATGSILFTTLNQAPNSTYFVKLHIRKNVP